MKLQTLTALPVILSALLSCQSVQYKLKPVPDPSVNTYYDSGVMNGLIENDDIIIRCSGSKGLNNIDIRAYFKNKGKAKIDIVPETFLLVRSYTSESNIETFETNKYSFESVISPLNKARRSDKNIVSFSETNALARDYDYRMIEEDYNKRIEAMRQESLSGKPLMENEEVSGLIRFSLPEGNRADNYYILQMPVGNAVYRVKFTIASK